MNDLRRSQEDNTIEWQSPKIILPKLPNKRGGSLPSYNNLKSGGGDGNYIRSRPLGDMTSGDDYDLQIIRTNEQPSISARSWLVYDMNEDRILKSNIRVTLGCNPRMKREVASLTKMMTALCTLQLVDRFNMTLKQTYFRVTQTATDVSGTLANLQPYQWININDLLYGMMLPSGNDAANLLAQNLGAIIYFDIQGEQQLLKQIRSIDLTEDEDHIRKYMEYFMEYMNNMAKRLGLTNSKFTNPHGLDYRNNCSSCQDMLKITILCHQNQVRQQQFETIQKICSTKEHRAEIRVMRNKMMYKKGMTWTNTNKLLGMSSCKGTKTGYTPKAGGCLATVFQSTNRTLIIIVIGSKSQEHRFSDTTRILQWIFQQSY